MSASMPLISIFTVVKNGANTIRRCLDSVLALEYPNIEHVIQDGASTDGTLEILQEYARARPDVIKIVSEPDSCSEEGFFRGFKRCQGEWIGCCLADETLLPGAGKWVAEAFKLHPLAGAVYGDLYLTDSDGKIQSEFQPPHPYTVEKYLLHEVNPPFASTFFRRGALDAIDFRSYSWAYGMGEFELWVRLSLEFSVHYVPGLVATYAVHAGQLSCSKKVMLKLVKTRCDYLKRLFATKKMQERFGAIYSQTVGGLHLFIAEVLRDGGSYPEAADLLLKAMPYRPNKEPLMRVMQGFYNQGSALVAQKRFQEAVVCWEPLAKLGVEIPQLADMKRLLAQLEPTSMRAKDNVLTTDEHNSVAGPLVSVIINCHNYADHLLDAVGSILAQTYTNFEMVIIDDGSTDDSLKIAQSIAAEHGKDVSIRVFHLDDVGPSAARRFGFDQARGSYIVPLDADDKMAPQFLEKTVLVLEADHKLGFAYTDTDYFGDKIQRINHPEYDFTRLCAVNFIAYCSLIRRAAFEAVDGYDRGNWGYYEDWDLWIRLGEAGWHGRHIAEPLFLYNHHFGSSLSAYSVRLDAIYRAYLINQHPKLYSPSAVAKGKQILAEMPPGWHAQPPLKDSGKIQALLVQYPGNRHLQYFLALAQARSGHHRDAMVTLNALLSRHPGDEQARKILEQFSAEVALELPSETSNRPVATTQVSGADQTKMEKLNVLKTQAQELLTQEKWSEAAELCADVMAKEPDDQDILFIFAHALANLGAIEDALTVAKRLLALQPGRVEFLSLAEMLEKALEGIVASTLENNALAPSGQALEDTIAASNSTELKLVAGKFDTDKGQGFLDQYERFFSHLVDRKVRILEIGVLKGGSLLMWQDYFKKGEITGLDLNPVLLNEKAERIRIYQGYQQDGGLLDRIRNERAPEGFDIIIDDASHLGNLTRETFNHLFDRHLKPGGIYVIEDWGTGYWDSFPDGKKFVQGVPHHAGMVGFIKELVDEAGMGDVTKTGQGGISPARESKFEGVYITGGQVFVTKKQVQEKRPGMPAGVVQPITNSQSVAASVTVIKQEVSPRAVKSVAPKRIIALVSAYNEGDVIYHVVGDLIANGVEVYFIDNNSTDNTIAEASKWLGKGLLKIERFPQDAGLEYSKKCEKEYVWSQILRRKEELATQLGADWYIHADADEFRESPWPGKTLAEAIVEVDARGYNAINFELLNFRPTDDAFVPGTDVRQHLVGYEKAEILDVLQIKAWKNPGQRVQLVAQGGHSVEFPGRRVFPLNFILRHYPIRGETHGRRKVFKDRVPRFAREEVAQNWHIQYNSYVDGTAEFLYAPDKLGLFNNGEEVRAKLLSEYAEDEKLVAALRTHEGSLDLPSDAALCAWVGGELGFSGSLPLGVWQQAEQVLGQLLSNLAAGKKDLDRDLEPAVVRLLLVLLKVKSAFARFSGHVRLVKISAILSRLLVARLTVMSTDSHVSTNLDARPISGAETLTLLAQADLSLQQTESPHEPDATSDEIFGAEEVQSFEQLATAYANDPADAGISGQLRELQQGVMNFLVTAETERLEGHFKGSLGRVFRALVKSGLTSEAPTEESQAQLAILDEALAGPEAADGSFDYRPLFARMLCGPAHRGALTVAPGRVPAWFLNDYLAYVLHAPQVFVAEGEAEQYKNYLLGLVRSISERISVAPKEKLTLEVASYFALRANYIPLYFANSNTRELAEKRAAIMEFVLARNGAVIDYTPPKRGKNQKKMKVGYLSAHFGAQTETHVTLPTLQLDRTKFEVCLFAVEANPGPIEDRCRGFADTFTRLPKQTAEQVAMIRNAKLDVLIIGTNVTAVTNQVSLLALHRLAPVQLVSYCSPVSTGMRHVDGYLTGSHMDFPGIQEHFSEKLMVCDGPPGCLDYTVENKGSGARFTREGLGLAADDVVFINAAACFKILPEMQETWAKILKAVPKARLLLLPFNPNWSSAFPVKQFERTLTEACARQGLGREVFVLANSLPSRADVKELEKLADVYLDTFPFSGSISVIDPLELGIPSVVWEGKTPRSRMASALLRELGVTELITQDEESYIRLSIKLATEPVYRRQMSERIKAAMAKNPRFVDAKVYGQGLSKVLESLVAVPSQPVPAAVV